LQPGYREQPFLAEELAPPFPLPVHREWATFHQNYSYEQFILALRPEPAATGFSLRPRLGTLLEAATRADPRLEQPDQERASAALVCIDEVNRGNVSRILGEFITFMDRDYRATVHDEPNGRALPVPLPNVRVQSAPDGERRTEPIERMAGGELALPVPWHFPEHVYVLASMNSVDRAVAPLDTALARRFVRIEVPPDLCLLARHLGLPRPDVLLARRSSAVSTLNGALDPGEMSDERIQLQLDESGSPYQTGRAGEASEPGVAEIAWFLLYRLNYELAAALGPDFELGHTYLWEVGCVNTEAERLRALAAAWDQTIYPQLRERFINRPDELLRLLRISRDGVSSPCLLKMRPAPPGGGALLGRGEVLEPPRLEERLRDRPEEVQATLRHLAGL
jgi:hypothetical protein